MIEHSDPHETSVAGARSAIAYAGFWQRFVAMWIDFFVFVPLVVAETLVESSSKAAAVVLVIPIATMYAGYSIWLHGRYGQTLGKRAMRIRVVRTTGERIGWREAWLRSSVQVCFAAIGVVGSFVALAAISDADYYGGSWMRRQEILASLQPAWFDWTMTATTIWAWSEVVVMLFNRRRRALHDFIAGTIVVREQTAASGARLPTGSWRDDTAEAGLRS